MDNLAFPYHPLQFRSAFFAPLFEHIIFAMSVNDARGRTMPRGDDAAVGNLAWVGNIPGFMTEREVALHICRHGYGMPINVYLNSAYTAFGLMGGTKWGIVTFSSEEAATIFRQAGQSRRGLYWPDGRYAIIRAVDRGIIPGGRHQKAGVNAAQKASKRQFCG